MKSRDACVPLRRQPDLPEEYQYLLSEDALGERNVLCAIGNSPPLLQAYMRYGTALWKESGLSPRDLEFVILVVARALGSKYEWQQHVELGQEVGLSLEVIRAVGDENWSTFDERRWALISYVRSFLDGTVSEREHADLGEHFEDATVVGVGTVIAHYVATASLVDAWNVPVEGTFVGWHPE